MSEIDVGYRYALGIARQNSLNESLIFCLEEEKFYKYGDGFWCRLSHTELMDLIMRKHGDKLSCYTLAKRMQILDNLKTMVYKKVDEFNKSGFLNFDQGEFDPLTGTLHPHLMSNYSTMRMPYQWDDMSEVGGSNKCELWIKTLNEIFEADTEHEMAKDKIGILQEFFGYCLTKDTRKEKALLLLGQSRCLGGETLIFDPIKNKSISVSEIETDFHVQSWDGEKIVVAKALKPFRKEIDDLYTVTLSNGQNFVCSKSHLILTNSGYCPLSELHEGCEVFLPSTISDNDQPIPPSNEKRCLGKPQGYSNDYRSLHHFYGGLLQMVKDIFLNDVPLRADVQQHISCVASLQKDGLGHIQEYNHHHQPNDRPSTLGVLNLSKFLFYKLWNVFYRIYKLTFGHNLASVQSMLRTCLHSPIFESFPSDNCSCSTLAYNTSSLVITSIVYKRKDVKYDFTVPIYHNYICGGAVHHNSGKSTILETLGAMLGKHNCAYVTMDFISNPQYTPLLMNKLCNIDTDVNTKADNFESKFKTITSGETLTCNQKFVETFDFVPYCKLAMGANSFPRITDHSMAIYNRLILLPCDRVFELHERNIGLKDQLKSELFGILMWAVEGLHRLNKRGHFEEKDYMKDAIEELREESNPVEVFFKEFIIVDMNTDCHIEKGELYEKYRQWSIQMNQQYSLSAIRFGRAVCQKYARYVQKDYRLPNGGPRAWKNLRYKDSFMALPQKDLAWDE